MLLKLGNYKTLTRITRRQKGKPLKAWKENDFTKDI